MLASDELTAAVKTAETALKAAENTVTAERAALRNESVTLAAQLEKSSAEREALVAAIDPQVLATYERVAKGRKGIAVAAARNGHCTVCHVRLRPQMFNEVRRNDSIIQCDSCQRVLYFDSTPEPASQPASPPPA
jgi:predicted  nucleic acid-binding Zn-ribbon protein